MSTQSAEDTKSGVVTRERQQCEVYSRIVGYLRPIQNWNEGKKAEYKDRKEFDLQ